MREAPADFWSRLKERGGVVDFDVTGDSKQVMRSVVTVALQAKSSFEYFRVVENENGSNELHFIWYCPTPKEDIQKLPFPLKDVDATMMFIGSWIQEKGKFDPDSYCGGDGDNHYGFRLTNQQECEDWRNRTDHLCLRVCPTYVYYGK